MIQNTIYINMAYGPGRVYDISLTQFVGGENIPHINQELVDLQSCYIKSATINKSIESPADLFVIAQIVDILRRKKINTINLTAPYIFGARQDRVCNDGEAFTSKVVANMINSLDLSIVKSYYPHSDVLPALINNCEPINDIETYCRRILNSKPMLKKLYVVSPDAGAAKRVFATTTQLVKFYHDVDIEYIEGTKKRNVTTGKLSSFGINVDKIDPNAQVLVIDDICANGGTFCGLADKLVEVGATKENMSIFVFHADAMSGLENILPYYSGGVYTTDSRDLDDTTLNGITILGI